jgi:hypothetical protein
MAWLDRSVVVQMFFLSSFHNKFKRFRVPIRIGQVRSVQFIVWAGAYRALIDITQECLSNLFPIHYQQMVKCPAASDKSNVWCMFETKENTLDSEYYGNRTTYLDSRREPFQQAGFSFLGECTMYDIVY